jgi:hypothetical protein
MQLERRKKQTILSVLIPAIFLIEWDWQAQMANY